MPRLRLGGPCADLEEEEAKDIGKAIRCIRVEVFHIGKARTSRAMLAFRSMRVQLGNSNVGQRTREHANS